MAKYDRREDLVEKSFCFKRFGKRLCDCSPEEKREYFRLRKQASREKDSIQESEKQYRKTKWEKQRGFSVKNENGGLK